MRLEELGLDLSIWGAAVADARQRHGDCRVGRVAADFGVEHRIIGEFGDERATLTGKLRHADGVRPAVGDFVVVSGTPPSLAVVEVLPRKSALTRQAAGKKMGAQTIAANLDVVFVVTSCNEDFNLNRIERYLTAIRDGGARGVVLLNKGDLVEPAVQAAHIASLRERVGDVDLINTRALDADGLDELRAELHPRETSSFVGSSGVGKSTIVNGLLGEQRQSTAEVQADAKGRHTTTHRELFVLAGGAIVIDTPGMREFQIWDEGDGLAAFDDIATIARECRFRDCVHEHEPGCAVRAAIEAGQLTEQRLESWRKLRREADAQRAKRRRDG